MIQLYFLSERRMVSPYWGCNEENWFGYLWPHPSRRMIRPGPRGQTRGSTGRRMMVVVVMGAYFFLEKSKILNLFQKFVPEKGHFPPKNKLKCCKMNNEIWRGFLGQTEICIYIGDCRVTFATEKQFEIFHSFTSSVKLNVMLVQSLSIY